MRRTGRGRGASLPLGGAIALACLAAGPSAAGAQERVESGRLAALVESDPWHLELHDRAAGAVLSESRATDVNPIGSLGFSTLGAWWHATRVVAASRDGAAYTATLATTDPAGRRIEVRVEPVAEGVIRLIAAVEEASGVESVGIAFDARKGERYLGFGERSNAVDQRGTSVESYVSDGPYHPDDRPFFNAFIPPQGYHARDDATYFPMPWLLSTGGYGVLADNAETSLFRLNRADAWGVEAQASRLELRFFAGPAPADVVRRLTAEIGRQPPPAAPWFFGPWFQPRRGTAGLGDLDKLAAADVPTSAVNTYLHYLPCGDQVGRREDERKLTSAYHGRGVAITTYFNPMVCNDYQPVFDEAASRGALIENALGQPYVYRYTSGLGPDREFLVSQFDFTTPAADEFFGALLAEAVEDGHDGWMEDFGEYTPLDARSADGTPGARMHNLYPVLYHRSSWRFASAQARPVAGFIRSGWTGVHPYAQLVWGGDPTTDWGFDGLASALTQGLTMGLSGISRWGSDIGGFFSINARSLSPELLVRWIELGAVSGVMRTEASGVSVPSKSRPQVYDDELIPTWKRYAKLRTQLYPYLAAADARYRASGLPLMSHLALVWPEDPRAAAQDDAFMFGPDLLAAPVVRAGQRERRVYLPGGAWVDFWRAVSLDSGSGAPQLGHAVAIGGGHEVTLPAPLDELPLLVRAGGILPLLPADVDTLADYGAGGAVRLADRRRRLTLLAFPRGHSEAGFGERGRVRSREGRRRWTLGVAGRQRTRYTVQASLATLHRPFRPRCVKARGRRLPHRLWRYERATRVLRARFRLRRGRLVVSRRDCRR